MLFAYYPAPDRTKPRRAQGGGTRASERSRKRISTIECGCAVRMVIHPCVVEDLERTRGHNEGPGLLVTPAPACEGVRSCLTEGSRRDPRDVWEAAPVVVVVVVVVVALA